MKILYFLATVWSFYRVLIEINNRDLGWTVFWIVIFSINLYSFTDK